MQFWSGIRGFRTHGDITTAHFRSQGENPTIWSVLVEPVGKAPLLQDILSAWERGGYILSLLHFRQTEGLLRVVQGHPVSEYTWTTPKTRTNAACRLAFNSGITRLWISSPNVKWSLLPHGCLNSWQYHQQSHCHRQTVQVQAQLPFFKIHLSTCCLRNCFADKNMLVYVFHDSEHSPPPACYPGILYAGMVTMGTVAKLKMFSLS